MDHGLKIPGGGWKREEANIVKGFGRQHASYGKHTHEFYIMNA